jgi:hypothetical protein
MSGNAALSAARKRRASSSPMGAGGGGGASPSQPSAYYNRTTPTAQQLMNQTFPEHNNTPQFQGPRESAPNVPINIYENIELIRQQIAARTKVIQTQGNAIPVDKLRILQKQNEIQTQILQQKMAIAQQMEKAEQGQQQKQQQKQQQQLAQMAIPSMNEPEFIYEKGIPRKNPKYKTPAEIEEMKQARAQVRVQTPPHTRGQTNIQMTPFVSMITETGVFPPPIVILKSHDAKLEEHDNVIQDIIQQLDYLHSQHSSSSSAVAPAASAPASASSSFTLPTIKEDIHKRDADVDADEEEPEQELLMEVVMNDLTNSREFVEGIVDKIVNDTNLSDVIMKIEPLVKENQELRSLIHSQQQMMNEMNTMLLRLLNTNGPTCSSSEEAEAASPEPIVFQDNGLDCDGLYENEMTEIMLSNSSEVVVIDDPDTEPAQIIDTSDDASAEADEAPAEPADDEAPAEPAADEAPAEPADDEAPAEPAADEDEEAASADLPHFPEPITLLVSEI